MVKRLILIISLVILVSCASRKVDVSKVNVSSKVDSSLVMKIDGTYTKENDIVVNETDEEIEYIAADTSKPMVINGKEYKNVIIKSKKQSKRKVDKTKEKNVTSSIKKLNVKKDDVKKEYNKKVDKKANYYVLLWLLLPVLIIWFLEKYSSKIFPFIKYFK
jgi:hypothetical protein